MCVDMCKDVCRHMYGRVDRHVDRHVNRDRYRCVDRHVFRCFYRQHINYHGCVHVHRDMYGHVDIDTSIDMCTGHVHRDKKCQSDNLRIHLCTGTDTCKPMCNDMCVDVRTHIFARACVHMCPDRWTNMHV